MAELTKLLSVALKNKQAGLVSMDTLLEVCQSAIDNGDILCKENYEVAATFVLPLIDEGVLTPSEHSCLLQEIYSTDIRHYEAGLSKGRLPWEIEDEKDSAGKRLIDWVTRALEPLPGLLQYFLLAVGFKLYGILLFALIIGILALVYFGFNWLIS